MVDSETQLCPKCGATVRKKASFCFKCGTPIMIKPLQEEIAPENEDVSSRDEGISNVWFQETIVEGSQAVSKAKIPVGEIEKDSVAISDAVNEEAEKETQTETSKVWAKEKKQPIKDIVEASDVKIEETSVPAKIDAKKIPTKDELAKLRAAKSGKKTIEVVWEEPNSNPTWKLMLATIFFAAIAIGVFIMSRMLK